MVHDETGDRPFLGPRAGYTLAEVMVASSLMMILGAALVAGIIFVQRSSAALNYHTEMLRSFELATARFERDVSRSVRVALAEADELILVLEDWVDSEGEAPDRQEWEVRYWVDSAGAFFFREEEGDDAPRRLLTSLHQAEFKYSGRVDEIEETEEIRRIAFAGVMRRQAGPREVIEQVVSASFLLRNLTNGGEEDWHAAN